MKRKFKSFVSVILSLMMIISMASIGFITTNAADTTAKIYFDNSKSNWSSVAIWAWDDDKKNYTGGTWPGQVMTNEGNNIWSFDLNVNAKNVIFNNNNNNEQTDDIKLPGDWTTKEKVFKSDGSSYNKDGSVDPPDILSGEKIYFDNSISKWSNVYIYLWKGDENPDTNNENFSGNNNITTPMTKIEGTDIWYYQFINDYRGRVIFRAENGDVWTTQTNNILLSDRGENNCLKPKATVTKPDTEWTTYSEVTESHNVTINSNIKVTATPDDGTAVVLNETGDNPTENSINVSASTLTLTASAVDYNFAGWKLGEGATIKSGSVTDPTITVKVTADTTITATAITLTPRLSVNSSVAKNTTAKVKPGEQFTLNALSKVGDKTQKATKYTVDFYQYTTNIKNAQKIGSKEITNVDYDKINNLGHEPLDGEYLIGNEYPAVLPVTINEVGTYHFYADIKGYDNAENLTTGEYADVSLGTSRLKDEVTVNVVESLNKATAYDNGLWVDVQPSVVDSKIALLKWTHKSGSSGNSGNTYTLYVPGGIKLNEMPVYSKFNTLKINDTTVAQGGTYNFTNGGTYSVNGDNNTYTLKVYQSTSDSMFTTTTLKNPADSEKAKDGDNLPTRKYDGQIDKVEYNGHFMSITASDGKKCDDVDIEKIKGRGNSSWKASGEQYGKYAYNVKFTSKIKPLKMTEATKAKSWCLLANNMDPSALRNVSIYQTAKLAGLSNVPEYKVADFYNNGEYLGSYLITEKVDVGGSKLVDGDTAEDHYTGGTGNQLNATLLYDGNAIEYHYVDTGSLKVKSTAEDGTQTHYTAKDFSYLLEFDLEDRAKEEHCWFKTPKGQYVVVKAPEDLNKTEMEFIIQKWLDAENAVYTNNYTKMNELMNLDSFADVYLVQEFTKNLDSCTTSYFVYWDGTTSKTTDASDVKWEATPIWDYDWALGGYYKEKNLVEVPGDESSKKPNDKDGWYAKYKCVTRRDVVENGKYPDFDTNTYNLQAQLANNSDFWKNNVVNAWNSDFYDSITSVYSNNGYLKSAYDANYNSFDMNEKRYGFINSNPTYEWGTVTLDTGKKTPQGAYDYLSDWAITRANWMNDRIGETVTVSLDSDSTEIKTGNTVTLTANLSRDKSDYPMTYQYYMSTNGVNYIPIGEATTDTSLTTDALTAAGTYYYKVSAMYSTYTKATSDPLTVKVIGESSKLTGVSLTAPSTAVTGSSIILRATPETEGSVTGITYSYYMSKDNSVSEDDTLFVENLNSTSYSVKVPDTAGKYYYYVKAVYGDTTVTSALVAVDVSAQIGTHTVTFKFKAPSAYAYVPTITLDGTAHKMTKEDQSLGSIYSGALKIYWYTVDIEVDSTKSNTIRITTQGTNLNASYTSNFNGNEYYLGVDDLMTGTEVVNLTNEDEYIRNYYHTPTHMVHSEFYDDGYLGFTVVEGVRYRMGSYKRDGKSTFSVDSVTAIQKLSAESLEVSELQTKLFDCNLDGVVDINDATLMQKALAQ